jgi:hypothetical protein
VSVYRYCPSCGAEYRAGYATCAECNVELIDEAPDDASVRRSEPGEIDLDTVLVEVYRTDRRHAELVRSFLEANAIPAITSGEGYSSAYPLTVGAIGERRVLVRDQDAPAARALIEQVDRPMNTGRQSAGSGQGRTLFGSRWLVTGLALFLLTLIVCGLAPLID